MMTYTRSPDTLAICFLAVFKPETVVIDVNAVERITAEVPVNKIL